jgi:hypothetical protein
MIDDDDDFDVLQQQETPAYPPPNPSWIGTNAEAIRVLNTLASGLALRGTSQPMDRWHNPLNTPQRVTFGTDSRLMADPRARPLKPADPRLPGPPITVTWGAGETIALHRCYRSTLQREIRESGGTRRIVSGSAPQLRRLGSETPIHPSLEPVSEKEAERLNTEYIEREIAAGSGRRTVEEKKP